MFVDNCPVCGKIKQYKKKEYLLKCIGKPCRSCSNSISSGGSGNLYNFENNTKKCSKCNEYFNFDKFNIIKDKLSSTCKKCSLENSNQYHIERYRFKKYGITKEEFLNLLSNQNYCCKICNSNTKLYIDHCHKTNKIRGLLCRDCNSAIGLLKENLDNFEKAIKYLKNSK